MYRVGVLRYIATARGLKGVYAPVSLPTHECRNQRLQLLRWFGPEGSVAGSQGERPVMARSADGDLDDQRATKA